MQDFTIEKYGELCSAIKKKYKTLTFEEYLNNLNFKENFVILRYDVDWMPRNALNTSEVENEFGIKQDFNVNLNNNHN